MGQTLETFCKKNDLYLVITKVVTTRIAASFKSGEKRKIEKETEWEYMIDPPVIARYCRVIRGGSVTTLFSGKGETRSEARRNFIKRLGGGCSIDYSNHFDRQSGSDFSIRVPRNIC